MDDPHRQYLSASERVNDVISSLPGDRRSHAEALMKALYEVVILDKESFTDVLGRFVFVGLFLGGLAVVPIGITAGLVAYFGGLSHDVGKWMFFASAFTCAVGIALGFMIGQGSPSRDLL
jgi:hypothetical protein